VLLLFLVQSCFLTCRCGCLDCDLSSVFVSCSCCHLYRLIPSLLIAFFEYGAVGVILPMSNTTLDGLITLLLQPQSSYTLLYFHMFSKMTLYGICTGVHLLSHAMKSNPHYILHGPDDDPLSIMRLRAIGCLATGKPSHFQLSAWYTPVILSATPEFVPD
jgi:hypothetical protein